jgi:DNA-binding response OmpR family regulator
MRDRFGVGGNGPGAPWLCEGMTDVFEGASILLVEDDRDIRELLVTLLKLAGFSPTACTSAEQGLEQLREQPFDLVLTDYALPHRSGGWLLQQARDEGLLDATPVLVVTAHPNPPDVAGFEIIQKPFDLDQLVDRVRRRLEAEGSSRPRQPRMTRGGGGESDDGQDDCPDPVELILYVSAHSERSATAIKNIKQALEGQRSRRVTLTICDLSKDPSLGQRDAVPFTPRLVKRSPGPRTFILGHITSPELVLELLGGCDES